MFEEGRFVYLNEDDFDEFFKITQRYKIVISFFNAFLNDNIEKKEDIINVFSDDNIFIKLEKYNNNDMWAKRRHELMEEVWVGYRLCDGHNWAWLDWPALLEVMTVLYEKIKKCWRIENGSKEEQALMNAQHELSMRMLEAKEKGYVYKM